MTGLEAICLGIVLAYVAPRIALASDRGATRARLLLIAIAAWAGEASCVHGYGLYGYDTGPWTVMLPGGVPLLVPLIWPVVIHSAWDLARRLVPGPRGRALTCAAIVLADAALIEPVAVHAGLWTWTEPGLFGAPPVGILGWGIFAFFTAAALERSAETRGRTALGLLLLPPLLIHPVLLALWWGGLRWVNHTVDPRIAIGIGGAVSLALSIAAARSRPRGVRAAALSRAPGAAFFFGLLVLHPPPPLLLGWVVVFALPYGALLACGRAPSPAVEPPAGD